MNALKEFEVILTTPDLRRLRFRVPTSQADIELID